MTTIFLHGYLRDLHPEPIEVEANSAAEALTSLQLIPAIAGMGRARHPVRVPGFESRAALYEKRVVKEIHVHPLAEHEHQELLIGAGRPGVAQIIIGVIMIIGATMMTGPIGGVTAGQIAFGGAMMILGGVLQLLAPQPKLDSNERSRYLGQGKNTVAIGTRIPLIYGRAKAYGHYLSFNMDSGRFDGAPESWYSSPYTDYGSLTNSAGAPQVPMENPQGADKYPTSAYLGLAYPESMVEENVTYITFNPTVLLAGPYDLNFANGKVLHVENLTAGTSSRVTLRGGETTDMPPVGTNIVFTRNYG